MLDWKNRFGRLGSSGHSARADGTNRNPLLLGLALLLGLYLFVALLVGWYWSSEPDRFPVQQHVRQAAEASQQQIVNGAACEDESKHRVDREHAPRRKWHLHLLELRKRET